MLPSIGSGSDPLTLVQILLHSFICGHELVCGRHRRVVCRNRVGKLLETRLDALIAGLELRIHVGKPDVHCRSNVMCLKLQRLTWQD